MIKPQPFKYQCSQCGYSKIVAPKSDVLNPLDFIDLCPKCQVKMRKVDMILLDKFKILLLENIS